MQRQWSTVKQNPNPLEAQQGVVRNGFDRSTEIRSPKRAIFRKNPSCTNPGETRKRLLAALPHGWGNPASGSPPAHTGATLFSPLPPTNRVYFSFGAATHFPPRSLVPQTPGESRRPPMPKRTFQPNRRHRSKVHGFLTRMKTKAGQAVLNRRRAKGRHKIAVSAGFRD